MSDTINIGNCPTCNHFPTQFIDDKGKVVCREIVNPEPTPVQGAREFYAKGYEFECEDHEHYMDFAEAYHSFRTQADAASEHVSMCGDKAIEQLDYAMNATPEERMTAVLELCKLVPAIRAYFKADAEKKAEKIGTDAVEVLEDLLHDEDQFEHCFACNPEPQPSSDWVQKAAEEAATKIKKAEWPDRYERFELTAQSIAAIIRAAIERNKQ